MSFVLRLESLHLNIYLQAHKPSPHLHAAANPTIKCWSTPCLTQSHTSSLVIYHSHDDYRRPNPPHRRSPSWQRPVARSVRPPPPPPPALIIITTNSSSTHRRILPPPPPSPLVWVARPQRPWRGCQWPRPARKLSVYRWVCHNNCCNSRRGRRLLVRRQRPLPDRISRTMWCNRCRRSPWMDRRRCLYRRCRWQQVVIKVHTHVYLFRNLLVIWLVYFDIIVRDNMVLVDDGVVIDVSGLWK